MSKYIYAILLFSFLFSKMVKCQNLSGSIWCFGDSAEINFISGSPVWVNGCAISTEEGSASICDSATGKLLFYTDGTNVWNKNNAKMPGNTIPLGGNLSSTQSALIVPIPGNASRYYIFTTDAEVGWYGGDSSLSYSIVDMTLDGGLGDILQQPQQLLKPSTEKLTATPMANGQGFWVVAHLWNSDAFYAYPVTQTGIGTPTISNQGSVPRNIVGIGNAAALGYMKISPDGSKLAQAIAGEVSTLELFNFNNTNGSVNGLIFSFPTNSIQTWGPYGVCFSPNSKILYSSYPTNGSSTIIQYNLSLNSGQAMIDGRDSFYTSGEGGAIQTAPDGKIYCDNGNFFAKIDRINNPNVFGPGCNFERNAFALPYGQCNIGLPNTIDAGTLFKDSLKDSLIVMDDGCPDSCKARAMAQACCGVPPYTYKWLNSNQNDSIDEDLCPGKYFVVINDAHGMSITDSVIIGRPAALPVTVSTKGDTLTCINDSTVQWYFDNAPIPGANISLYIAKNYGDYTAVGVDSNDCAFTRYAKYANADYFFPNAFTPDGNGINDFYYPMLGGNATLVAFQVFNRWGELVYDNVTSGWDGKFKGVLQPVGVYVYYAVLEISDSNGVGQDTSVKRKGSFTLLR